jgi:hypothetical protein
LKEGPILHNSSFFGWKWEKESTGITTDALL